MIISLRLGQHFIFLSSFPPPASSLSFPLLPSSHSLLQLLSCRNKPLFWMNSAWCNKVTTHFHILNLELTNIIELCLKPFLMVHLSNSFKDNYCQKSIGVGCHFLLQGIFPTQGLNPSLPHCRQTLYHLSHQGRNGSSSTVGQIIRSVTKRESRTHIKQSIVFLINFKL